METTPSLTPSSELISSAHSSVAGPGGAGPDQLSNLDLSSLFSSVPAGAAPSAGIEAGLPVAGSGSSGAFTMDLSLVSSGILTIDPSSMGATLVSGTSLAKPLDPLVLAPGAELTHQHGLEGAVGDVLPPQGTLNLDDVQTVTPEALGTLAALTMQGASVDPALQHPLGSSSGLAVEPSAALAVAPVPELLASPSKVVEVGGQGGAGHLLGCVEVLGPQDGGKVLTSQFVFPSSSFSPQKDLELSVSPSSFLVRTSPPLWAPLSWPSIPEATSAIYPKLAIDGESDTASIFGRSGEDSGLVLFSLESLNLERCRSLKLFLLYFCSVGPKLTVLCVMVPSSGQRRFCSDRLQSHPAGQEEEAERFLSHAWYLTPPLQIQKETRLQL